MDPTGCSEGLFTDRLLETNPPVLCNVTLAEYWGGTITLCLLRLIAFIAKFRHFLFVYQTKSTSRRVPISLLNSLWSTISYFLLAILSGLNIANAGNGWTYSLYSMAYLGSAVDLTMMFHKLVRLGRRVITLPRTQELGNTEYLTKFTRTGKMLMIMQVGMIILSSVALIILSPILPDQEYLLGTIGFASKGIFQFLVTSGIVLQLERCVQALDRFIAQKNDDKSADARIIMKISQARKMLRIRQLYITILSSVVGLILILLSGRAIPWTWAWLIVGTGAPEAAGNILVELVFNRKSQSKPSGRSTEPALAGGAGGKEGNNNQQAGGGRDDDSATGNELSDVVPSGLSFSSSKKKRRNKKKKAWRLNLSRITEADEMTRMSRVPPSRQTQSELLLSSEQSPSQFLMAGQLSLFSEIALQSSSLRITTHSEVAAMYRRTRSDDEGENFHGSLLSVPSIKVIVEGTYTEYQANKPQQIRMHSPSEMNGTCLVGSQA